MRDRFPLVLIGFLILIGTLATFLMRGANRGSFADTLSTYRSEPDGARALFLFAEQSKLPVVRLQSDLEITNGQKNLALLAVEFREHTFDKDLEHVSFMDPDGGVDDDDEESPNPFSKDEDRLHRGANLLHTESVTQKEREKLLEHVKSGATVIYVPWGHRENPFLRALDVALWKADKRLEMRTLIPDQPSRYTRGVERVEARVQSFLGLPPGAVPLLVDEKLGEAVAALVPYGQGEVIIIGSPELAMNQALARADNALFWKSLLATVGRTGPIAFDEYHHGFTSNRSIADFAARYGLQFAVLQLVLGVCLWAAALRRFGRPKALKEDERLSGTDALVATSRLYREGGHHAHAASAILRELSSAFAGLCGLPARSEVSIIAATLDQHGRKDLSLALVQVSQSARAAVNEAGVQRVATEAALARTLAMPKRPSKSSTAVPKEATR